MHTSCQGHLSREGLFLMLPLPRPPPSPLFPPQGEGRGMELPPGAGGHQPQGRLSTASASRQRAGAFPAGDTCGGPPGLSFRVGGREVTAAHGSSSPFSCRWRVSGCTCCWGRAGRWGHPDPGTDSLPAPLLLQLNLSVWTAEQELPKALFIVLLAKSPSLALPDCALQGDWQLGDIGTPQLVWMSLQLCVGPLSSSPCDAPLKYGFIASTYLCSLWCAEPWAQHRVAALGLVPSSGWICPSGSSGVMPAPCLVSC